MKTRKEKNKRIQKFQFEKCGGIENKIESWFFSIRLRKLKKMTNQPNFLKKRKKINKIRNG